MGASSLDVARLLSLLRSLVALLGAVWLSACPPSASPDFDEDGVPDERDCNSSDPEIHQNAEDRAGDGIDQNCDGTDGVDNDRDGFPSVASGGDDCNDDDASVFVGAAEVPNNAVDEDCDGEALLCDRDGDGREGAQCGGDDCDDSNASCQLDCTDDDGDGLAACQGDCDDSRATVQPAVDELCDGLDTDCDQVVPGDEDDADGDGFRPCDGDCDDADPALRPDAAWVPDADADGRGQRDATPAVSCLPPVGAWVPADLADDCDDADEHANPLLPETCDGVDNDCDGQADEGFDADGDGSTPCAGDCDDDDPHRAPGATEVCDGLDNDCDPATAADGGEADADLDRTVPCSPYVDHDARNTVDEELLGGADCDDGNPQRAPGQAEACDGFDNDCDGLADAAGGEGDSDADGYLACLGFADHGAVLAGVPVVGGSDCDDQNAARHPFHPEDCDGLDNDCGFGGGPELAETDDDADGAIPCSGFVHRSVVGPLGAPLERGGDCDDDNPWRHPGSPEVCDGFDNDCDGATAPTGGEGDADGDAWIGCAAWIGRGALNASGVLLVGGGDCDDGDEHRFPGNPEVCDGLDNDCDPATESGGSEQDLDQDGVVGCEGYVGRGASNTAGAPITGGGDCDDRAAEAFPLSPEVCDGLDNDCDGVGAVATVELLDTTTSAVPDPGQGVRTMGLRLLSPGPHDLSPAGPAAVEVPTYRLDQLELRLPPGLSLHALSLAQAAGFGDFYEALWTFELDYLDLTGITDDFWLTIPFTGTQVDAGDDLLLLLEFFASDADAQLPSAPRSEVSGLHLVAEAISEVQWVSADVVQVTASDNELIFAYRITATVGDADGDGDGFAGCADCDDADPSTYPGAPTTCPAGVDADCDGVEDLLADGDADGDGVARCAGDCDDSDPAVGPGASEACDGVDNDCDGTVDEGFDADGDGFLPASCSHLAPGQADCDDRASWLAPDLRWYADGDGDGWAGQDALGVLGCTRPPGTTSRRGDCDDADPSVGPGSWGDAHPGATGDSQDLDCDGADLADVQGLLWGTALSFDSRSARLLGDLDGDGTLEVAMGERIHTGLQLAVAGSAVTDAPWALLSPAPDAEPVGVGDLDGDGTPDVAVVAWHGSDPSGSTVSLAVLSGAAVAAGGAVDTAAATAFELMMANRSALPRLTPLGDLDRRGLPDLLATFDDDGEQVLVFGEELVAGGPADAVLVIARSPGGSTWGEVAVVGDLDGDGLPELALGEPPDAAGPGAVRIVAGADLAAGPGGPDLLLGPGGDQLSSLLGAGDERVGGVVVAVDDADGDGVDDLLVAAPGTGASGSLHLVAGADLAAGGDVSLAGHSLGRIDGDLGGLDGLSVAQVDDWGSPPVPALLVLPADPGGEQRIDAFLDVGSLVGGSWTLDDADRQLPIGSGSGGFSQPSGEARFAGVGDIDGLARSDLLIDLFEDGTLFPGRLNRLGILAVPVQ